MIRISEQQKASADLTVHERTCRSYGAWGCFRLQQTINRALTELCRSDCVISILHRCRSWSFVGLLIFLLLSLVASAQPQQPPPERPIVPPNSRDARGRPGPWDNDVLVYRVPTNGASEKLLTFERAGVPTLARLKDGRLIAAFQHFPDDNERAFDRVAVRFSNDEGKSWTKPEPITVEGLEQGLARPFDPTLVPLPDGRIRLYFTSTRSPDFRRATPAIYSAISTNGINYTFEPGPRFALEGRIVIDCAAALHKGLFHLIVPDNGTPADFIQRPERGEPPKGGAGYHLVSTNGLNFSRLADVKLSPIYRWLGNMQSDAGNLVFFGTSDRGVWSAISADGNEWQLSSTSLHLPGADPAVAKLRDGAWLIAVTGPPRPGTATARRQQ